MNKLDIYEKIKPDSINIVYYDDDSEDEGTSLVEKALLLLIVKILYSYDSDSEDIQNQLNEMCCLINIGINLSEFGQMDILLRTDNSYDLFWDILKRYAKNLLIGKTLVGLSDFDFKKILTEYDFDIRTR